MIFSLIPLSDLDQIYMGIHIVRLNWTAIILRFSQNLYVSKKCHVLYPLENILILIGVFIFRYQVRLPPYITCTQCVLQWTYFTGNQWGECTNGTQAQGCGKSETFRNCADVAIHSSSGGAIPPFFVDIVNPHQLFYKDYSKPAPYNVVPLVIREQVCIPNSLYKMVPGVRDWCQSNCLRYPPNCPEDICTCP